MLALFRVAHCAGLLNHCT